MTLNLKGIFLGAQHAIRTMMKSGGGSIVNTASIFGFVGSPHMPVYCASKGGIIALTHTSTGPGLCEAQNQGQLRVSGANAHTADRKGVGTGTDHGREDPQRRSHGPIRKTLRDRRHGSLLGLG
jgi:NAD(P)-dependent dehydrogenase (short-subunit alcohol dehydrogenase family)